MVRHYHTRILLFAAVLRYRLQSHSPTVEIALSLDLFNHSPLHSRPVKTSLQCRTRLGFFLIFYSKIPITRSWTTISLHVSNSHTPCGTSVSSIAAHHYTKCLSTVSQSPTQRHFYMEDGTWFCSKNKDTPSHLVIKPWLRSVIGIQKHNIMTANSFTEVALFVISITQTHAQLVVHGTLPNQWCKNTLLETMVLVEPIRDQTVVRSSNEATNILVHTRIITGPR